MVRVERIRREAERARYQRSELDGVLDATILGTLSTVVDARPLTVPMLYARIGDRLLLHGSTGAGALRRVAAGAPATLCVAILDGLVVADNLFNSSVNYRSAVVRGRLTLIAEDDAYDALTAMSERLIPGRSIEVAAHTTKELAATLVMAMPIEPDAWTVKVRTGPPDDPDVDPDAWAGVVPIVSEYGPPLPAPWVSADTAVPPSVRGYRDRRL
jgi:nitroimidazol reductase NimA-like FMN-containing flavoprotein (pyridoxamine 5'-phosphate oxidase superfamily)